MATERNLVECLKLVRLALDLAGRPDGPGQVAMPGETPQEMLFMLQLANGEAEQVAVASDSTGASESALRQAATRFVEKVCFSSDGDPYRVLSLNPWADQHEAKDHYRLLIRLFHPDRGLIDPVLADDYAAKINQAYSAVKKNFNDSAVTDSPPGYAGATRPVDGQPRRSARIPPQNRGRSNALLTLARHPRRVWGVIVAGMLLIPALVFFAKLAPGQKSDADYLAEGAVFPVVPGYLRPSDGILTEKQEDTALANLGTEGDVAREMQFDDQPPKPELHSMAQGQPVAVTHPGPAGNAAPDVPLAPVPAEAPKKSMSPAVIKPAPVAVPVAARPMPLLSSKPADRLPEATLKPIRVEQSKAAPPVAATIVVEAVPAVQDAPAPVQMARREAVSSLPATKTEEHPSEQELEMFMAEFVASYNQGDLEGFLKLLSQDVRTDKTTGKQSVRQGYERLFQSTSSRRLVLKNLFWQQTGGNTLGFSDYRITLLNSNEKDQRVMTGSFRFELAKLDGQTVIRSFYNLPDQAP